MGPSPHGGAEGGERVCGQAAGGGREGEWMGSRHGQELALRVRKMKASRLEHLGGGSSIQSSSRMSGPRPGQIRSLEGRNQEFSLGPIKFSYLLNKVVDVWVDSWIHKFIVEKRNLC